MKFLFLLIPLLSCSTKPTSNQKDFEKKLEVANSYLLKDCNSGNESSCSKYVKNFSILHGDSEARKIADSYCSKKEPIFCYLSAYLTYFSGDVGKGNEKQKHLCSQGNMYSCYFVGYMEHQKGRIKGEDKFNPYFKKSCDLGDLKACSLSYYYNDLKTDADQSFKKFHELLNKFQTSSKDDSITDLTQMIKLKYPDEYFKTLKNLCAKNPRSEACFLHQYDSLSKRKLMKKHQEVSQDFCQKGVRSACSVACEASYRLGDVKNMDLTCEEACLSGDGRGCLILGIVSTDTKRYGDGLFFNRLACVHGSADACFLSGAIYELGAQSEKAQDYYRLSCNNGIKNGCDRLHR